MHKGELVKQLAPYTDDQWVCVCLYSGVYPNGSQVIIQGIEPITPMKAWCYPLNERPPDVIGLVVHADNRELLAVQTDASGRQPITLAPDTFIRQQRIIELARLAVIHSSAFCSAWEFDGHHDQTVDPEGWHKELRQLLGVTEADLP